MRPLVEIAAHASLHRSHDVDIDITKIFGRSLRLELVRTRTGIIFGVAPILAQANRSQRHHQTRHSAVRRLQTIQQPLAFIPGMLAAARRAADIVDPGVDLETQHRRSRRSLRLDRVGYRPLRRFLIAQRFEQDRRNMLAVEGHRTSAIAIKIRETAVVKFELDVDAILFGPAASYPRGNPGQVAADLHGGDAALRLVGEGLLHSRSAEIAIDFLALENVREHLQRFQYPAPAYSFRTGHCSRKSGSPTKMVPRRTLLAGAGQFS